VQNDQGRFEHYLEMLLHHRVEGLIVIANSPFLDVDVLAALENNHLPTVLIGLEIKPRAMSAVTVDNQAGARAGLEHSYGIGHR